MLSSAAMAVFSTWNQWPLDRIIGYSLGIALFVLGIIIAWQTHRHNKGIATHKGSDSRRSRSSGDKEYEWSGPIRWDFSSPNAPLWISGNMASGEEAYSLKVRAFNAFGRNASSDPIMQVNGFVTSDSTAERFPIVFVVQVTEGSPYRSHDKILGIPANTDFQIQAHFTEEAQSHANPGIDPERFLVLHPNLTFVFEYDGNTFTRKFPLSVLENQVNDMRKLLRRNMGHQGGVRPRQ